MEKTTLTKSSLNLFITNIFPRILTIFSLPIFLRLIDDDIWGEISFLLAVQLIFSNILLFGSESSGFRFFASLDKNKKVKLKNKNILTTLLSVIFLLFLLEYLIGDQLFNNFNLVYGLPAKLSILTVFFIVANRQLVSYFKSTNSTQIIKKSIYVESLITLFFQFLFVLYIVNYFGFDDRMLASAYFMGQLFGNALRMFYLTRKLNIQEDNRYQKSNASINRYALYGYFYSIFSVMLTWQDRLIIQYFFEADVVAHYSTVYRLTDLHGVVIGASISGLAPFFWNLKSQKINIDNVFKSIISVSTYLGLTGVVLFEIFGRFYLPINYHYAIQYVPIIATGMIFSSWSALFALDLDKRFKNKQRAISMLIAFLVNLITNLLYIEKYGIIIAAISSTIAYFFAMSWNMYNSKISLKNIIGFSSFLNFLLICLFYILFYILNITSLVISITFLAYSLYFLIKELRNYKSLSERLSL
tara:strand:+ start:3500 stop:4915 length:1416 start_codon:yes stop_codon:yes gene_type:complete